jgi:hypothetical protein
VDELVKYMKALLLLQLHTNEEGLAMKPEVLLAKAGFAHKEIADLLGKNQAAVSKAISRSQRD